MGGSRSQLQAIYQLSCTAAPVESTWNLSKLASWCIRVHTRRAAAVRLEIVLSGGVLVVASD